MDGKECDVDTYQCVPLTCKEMTSKIGGSIKEKDATPKWFVGDTAEFCCEEGILHYSYPNHIEPNNIMIFEYCQIQTHI